MLLWYDFQTLPMVTLEQKGVCNVATSTSHPLALANCCECVIEGEYEVQLRTR